MRNVNKILAITIMLIFTILSCYNISFAEDEEFTCTLTPSSSEVEIGDEVTLTFAISSLSGFEQGIMAVSAEIEYDENVLEYVSRESLNDWSVTYNDESKMIEIDRGDYVSEASQMVGLIFKVKETTEKETTVKIKNILGSEEVDVDSVDISTTITIKEKQEEQPTTSNPDNTGNGETPTEEQPTTNEQPTTSTNDGQSQTPTAGSSDKTSQDKVSGSLPNLGAETIIIPVVCVVLIVMGIVSYIQYKKYKNIK